MKQKKIIPFSKYIRLIGSFIVVIFAVVLYVFGIRSTVNQDVVFNVTRGNNVSDVAENLKSKDLIDSIPAFKIAVRFNGGRIQSGQYDIPRGTSVWRIANMFANGDIATTTVVIPEGLTVKQIKELLINDHSLTGNVECGEGTILPVCNIQEGDLFPDTYKIARGTSRLALLDLMQKKMFEIKDNWEKTGKIAPKPLTNWNEVITLASIVQKETPKKAEMSIVASVYLNRLRDNMLLQADPTVVYAITDKLGDMRGKPLLSKHLKFESSYNTYINKGLPPTPIANVGLDAIRAVLQPADTNYLFFVADGEGGHKFSHTYKEHRKNHADWREIKKKLNK